MSYNFTAILYYQLGYDCIAQLYLNPFKSQDHSLTHNNIKKNKLLLQDAVDCPEWIVPFHLFKSLAEEVTVPTLENFLVLITLMKLP